MWTIRGGAGSSVGGCTADSGVLVSVTMLSVLVLRFQVIGCPSVGCARHKIVLTSFVLITDSRVDGCPWAWATLHTAMDDVAHGRGQRCPRTWTTDNSACTKEKRAGGIAYVPCMDGRKRRVETEVWQLVMSSGPTGIFVGVWGERCRAIDGFIVYKWHTLGLPAFISLRVATKDVCGSVVTICKIFL